MKKINRRRFMASTSTAALGAAAPNFVSLVGLRALLGFGQGITEPSAGSLIADYYPLEKRGRAFSIQQIMLIAGFDSHLKFSVHGWLPQFHSPLSGARYVSIPDHL